MSLLSVAVAYKLNDPVVWMLAGALGGLLMGQVMTNLHPAREDMRAFRTESPLSLWGEGARG